LLDANSKGRRIESARVASTAQVSLYARLNEFAAVLISIPTSQSRSTPTRLETQVCLSFPSLANCEPAIPPHDKSTSELLHAIAHGLHLSERHKRRDVLPLGRLYRGLCETVGLLMASPSPGRQVAVVPYIEGTLRLARRLAPRCLQVGIELALAKSRGEVVDVRRWDAEGLFS
jgi:hypothetical protein